MCPTPRIIPSLITFRKWDSLKIAKSVLRNAKQAACICNKIATLVSNKITVCWYLQQNCVCICNTSATLVSNKIAKLVIGKISKLVCDKIAKLFFREQNGRSVNHKKEKEKEQKGKEKELHVVGIARTAQERKILWNITTSIK